jgi:hypothetical protein
VVFRERGRAIESKLPDLSSLDEVADAVVLLDPVFALSAADLARLLEDLATRLASRARVVFGGSRGSEVGVLLERCGFSPARHHGSWLVAERGVAPEQGGS